MWAWQGQRPPGGAAAGAGTTLISTLRSPAACSAPTAHRGPRNWLMWGQWRSSGHAPGQVTITSLRRDSRSSLCRTGSWPAEPTPTWNRETEGSAPCSRPQRGAAGGRGAAPGGHRADSHAESRGGQSELRAACPQGSTGLPGLWRLARRPALWLEAQRGEGFWRQPVTPHKRARARGDEAQPCPGCGWGRRGPHDAGAHEIARFVAQNC